MIKGKCQNCGVAITVRIVKFVSDENDILRESIDLEVDESDLVCERCHA